MLPKWSVVQVKKFNTFEKNSTVQIVIYIWLRFNKCVCTHTRKIHTIGMFYRHHNFYLYFIDKEGFPWWLRW